MRKRTPVGVGPARSRPGSNLFRNTGLVVLVVTLVFGMFLWERTSSAVKDLKRKQSHASCRLSAFSTSVLVWDPIRVVLHKELFSPLEHNLLGRTTNLAERHRESDRSLPVGISSLHPRRFALLETRDWFRLSLQRLSTSGHVPPSFVHSVLFILDFAAGRPFLLDPSSLLHLESSLDAIGSERVENENIDFSHNKNDPDNGLIVVGFSVFSLDENGSGHFEIRHSLNDTVKHPVDLSKGDSAFVWLWEPSYRLYFDPSLLPPSHRLGLLLFVCPLDDWNYHENLIFSAM